MRKFVSNNIVILYLVIITTINASRILYLPLPKLHLYEHNLKSLPIVHESDKKPNEQRSISNEFIPLSALESNMYDRQDEDEKQETVNWDSLTDEKPVASHHVDVNELPSDQQHLNQLGPSYEEPLKSKNSFTNNEMNQLLQLNDKNTIKEPWAIDAINSYAARLQADQTADRIAQKQRRNDTTFLVLVGVCSLIGILGLVSAAIFWYKIQKRAEAALDAEYPSYGVTGPSSASKIAPNSTTSDRKLAQSAQMFHYQQQRQQMMAQEKAQLDAKPVHSDESDDEATGDKDYTVYECPGLAPTGEMEVRNPLFAEPDSSLTTSAFTSHPTTNNHYPQPTTTASPSSSPPKEKSLS